jgi:hypothetical protein
MPAVADADNGVVACFIRMVDVVARRTRRGPHEQFQVRFLVGGALLGLVVALISVASAAGNPVSLGLQAGFGVAMLGLILATRTGVALAILTWTTITLLGAFLVAQSLVYAELHREQLAWLVLLPQVSLIMVRPRSTSADTIPSRRPVALATALAIGLGLLILEAHVYDLTLDYSAPAATGWPAFASFVAFVIAVTGMMWLYDLSLRATELELLTLRRFLAICAWCKKIQDDDDSWIELERYLARREAPSLTHGICPTCERDKLAS